MSLLVVQLPARERLGGRAGTADDGAGRAGAATALPAEWAFVLSDDGRQVSQSGQAAAALLPRAAQRVLVLAAADVAWHRIDIPKAPAPRLRAALAGVLEEALLDDAEALHLALAAVESPDAGGLPIDRIVAAAEPLAEGQARLGRFHGGSAGEGSDDTDTLRLSLAGSEGAVDLPLGGSLARMLVGDAAGTRWSATPAAAAAAERWLGAPVPAQAEAEALLAAAATGSDLRQFDLVPRHRGTRALREGWRLLGSPAWRPVRWGLAALVAVQLVGLNAHAWQQRQQIAERKARMDSLLREAHPGVRVVLDAPLQMQRETELLRGRAGRVGASDFEALLAAAAASWPDGVGPASSVRFEPGRLTLAVPGWGEPQFQQFQQRLRAGGHAAEFASGQVSLVPPSPTRGGSR
jgi:general secretion pathway protein L